jgi:multidrug efflux pump
MLRLGDIADIRAATSTRRQVRCATRVARSSRWACRWPRAATSSPGPGAAGAPTHPPGRPAGGHQLEQVQDQPQAVSRSVGEFVQGADRGGGHRAGRQLHQPGPAHSGRCAGHLARPGGGITIPLVLAITFVTMYYWGVGLHKISLGSADHRAGPAGGRRHHRGRDDGAQARGGLRQACRRHLRLRRHRDADAHRHADHGGRLPAHRPGQVGVGEYTFAIFAVTSAALVISWLVSVYFVPYLGAWLLRTRKRRSPGTRRRRRTSCSTRRSTPLPRAW